MSKNFFYSLFLCAIFPIEPVSAQETPTPTATVTATATAAPTDPSGTPVPSSSPTPEASPTPTLTATATPTVTPTTTPAPPARYTMLDFDGDGLSDLASFENQSDGSANELIHRIWRSSDNRLTAFEYGSSRDYVAPGDYDGDGIWDYAHVRESAEGALIWRVSNGRTAVKYEFSFGVLEDVLLTGCDFKGIFRTSPALLRDNTLLIYNTEQGAVETVPLPGVTVKLIAQAYCADLDGDRRQELLFLLKDAAAPAGSNVKPPPAYKKNMTIAFFTAGGQELGRLAAAGAERILSFDANGDGVNELAFLRKLRNGKSRLVVRQAAGELNIDVGDYSDAVAGPFGGGGDSVYLWQSALGRITFPGQTRTQSTLPQGHSFLQPVNLHFTGGFTPEDPAGLCGQVLDGHDGPNGFLWKASDVHGGTLVVVLPRQYRKFRYVSVMKDGYNHGNLYFAGIANGNRQHWRSRSKARSFPDRALVVARSKIGTFCWKIGSSARRND